MVKPSIGNQVRPVYEGVKRLIVWVHEWGLLALMALLVLAFAVALWSVSSVSQDRALLIKTISNILSNDKTLDGNPHVQLVHLLKNVVLIWAGAKIYLNTAGLRIDRFIARHLVTGHTVIVSSFADVSLKAGFNQESSKDKTPLAIDLARSLSQSEDGQSPIVLVAKHIDEVTRKTLWDEGIIVLSHDIPLSQLSQSTNLPHAKKLIAMCADSSANIALTRIANAHEGDDGALIECKCMIEPLDVKKHFVPKDYFELNRLHQIRIFNESQLVARQLLKVHPPDFGAACKGGAIHVLLVGFGATGQAVLLQLAHIGHFKDFKPFKVTVVDRHIHESWSAIEHQFPRITDWMEVSLKDVNLTTISEQHLNEWSTQSTPFNVVYVCTKDEVANLKVAKMCLASASIPETAKVVAIDPPGGVMLANFKPEGTHKTFNSFSLTDVNAPEGVNPVALSLLESIDDDFPKALHEHYRRNNPSSGLESWENISELMRESNRHVADHFEIKLRAVGLMAVNADGESDAFIESVDQMPVLGPSDWELLAEMEHNRWWAEKSMQGWSPVSDDELRTLTSLRAQGKDDEFKAFDQRLRESMKHHCMRRFDSLFQDDQKKDRQTIEFCFRYFHDQGKRFVSSVT